MGLWPGNKEFFGLLVKGETLNHNSLAGQFDVEEANEGVLLVLAPSLNPHSHLAGTNQP